MSAPNCPEADVAGEHEAKRRRVLAVLDQVGADAVALTSATAVSWYLAGARTHVNLAADPVLAVRVDRDHDEVTVTSNESARLVGEELPPGMTVRERPWFAPPPALHAAAEAALADPLLRARSPLLPLETARFRRLGRESAAAVTDALALAEPGWSEHRLAAEVARGLLERGADPLVVLVAGEERQHLPHPLPTARPLGSRALVVVCARRHGLIANLSRSVAFRALSGEERGRQERILEVERAALDATVPGTRLADVLHRIAATYEQTGFGPDHWQAHHQGGVAGYAGRDPRATPDCGFVVGPGQAFAWNPWAPGAKVEDTVLLTVDGFEVLTADPRWPTVEVAGRDRPVPWER